MGRPKIVREHLFSPYTELCFYCGAHSHDDLVAPESCVPHPEPLRPVHCVVCPAYRALMGLVNYNDADPDLLVGDNDGILSSLMDRARAALKACRARTRKSDRLVGGKTSPEEPTP